MTHLTPGQFVDAVEGHLERAVQRHLSGCEACRRQLLVLTRTMEDAADGPVPEPSPLFWDHLSARVAAAVREEEPPRRGPGVPWFRWTHAVPAGALALIVLALVIPLMMEAGAQRVAGTSVVDQRTPGGEPEIDPAWRALADIVGPLDWDDASLAGLTVEPGDAEVVALELNLDEREELSRLIAGEIARLKS